MGLAGTSGLRSVTHSTPVPRPVSSQDQVREDSMTDRLGGEGGLGSLEPWDEQEVLPSLCLTLRPRGPRSCPQYPALPPDKGAAHPLPYHGQADRPAGAGGVGREWLVQSHSWANGCSQAPPQAPVPPSQAGHIPRASPASMEVTAQKQSPVPTWDLRQAQPLPTPQAPTSSSVGRYPRLQRVLVRIR